LLESSGSTRARDGLWLGLAEPEFEVRFACGQALQHLIDHHRELIPEKARVFAEVAQELERLDAPFVQSFESSSGDASAAGGRSGRRLKTGLQHTVTLLSLVLDAEALELSLRALESGRVALRGTALEYLENVLPDSVYRALQRRLGWEASERSRQRERESIVEDLQQSMTMLVLDKNALKLRR
jgi:hypothetical protein